MKEVEFGHVEATELHVKPHLPVLGPKLGKELGAVRAALAAGEFEQLDGGGFRVLGHELGPDEVLVERSGKEGWAVASDEGVTVALDTTLDAELELEGRVYDLIHTLNSMRKDAGAGADRPDHGDAAAGRRRPRRAARRVDQGRGAGGLARDRRRRRRRRSPRSELSRSLEPAVRDYLAAIPSDRPSARCRDDDRADAPRHRPRAEALGQHRRLRRVPLQVRERARG